MLLEEVVNLTQRLEKEIRMLVTDFEKEMKWKAKVSSLHITRIDGDFSHVTASISLNK